MPTSYTSLLGLALPVTGELSGTWGDTVNDYITQYLDSAVEGTQTISGSQTSVTLSVTNGTSLSQVGSGSTGSAQYAIINCTGNPASTLTITAPASSRQYLVLNSTSTSQSVIFRGAGPTTGVTLVSGERCIVAWNGSDFVKIATSTADGVTTFSAGTTGFTPSSATSGAVTLAGTLATTNGGTGLTSFTANGVVYASSTSALTTGSALSFDGSTFGVTGAATVTGDISTTSTGRLNVRGSGTGTNYDLQIDNSDTLVNFRASRSNAVTKAYAWYLDNSVTEAMRLNSTGLGIGTSSPGTKLVAVQTLQGNDVATGAELLMTTSTATNDRLNLNFSMNGIQARARAAIGAIALDATGGYNCGLAFYTRNANDGTALATTDERARIDSNGTFRVKGAGTAGSTDAVQFSGSAPASSLALTAAGFTQPKAYADTVSALGNTGTATTINLQNANVFTATLTGNCTFTLSNPIATGSSSFTLILTNDATPSRTVAWAGGSFVFPGGAASLSRTTTANAIDVWVFFTPNGGTTWYGNIAMKNMTA